MWEVEREGGPGGERERQGQRRGRGALLGGGVTSQGLVTHSDPLARAAGWSGGTSPRGAAGSVGRAQTLEAPVWEHRGGVVVQARGALVQPNGQGDGPASRKACLRSPVPVLLLAGSQA